MIEITASPKNPILIHTPIMFAAGFAGYDGSTVRKLLALDKFGALVTPPITLAPRQPATGPRIVPLPAGFLMHTGLPNPGVSRVMRDYDKRWKKAHTPVIVHLTAESPEIVEQAVQIIDRAENVVGIELGLHEQIVMRELNSILSAARGATDLPVMVQLPPQHALELGEAAQHSGAQGLVIAAPPRGTARDPKTKRLIGGRLYGPMVAAQMLRLVGKMVQYADVPVIACGGVHTVEAAEDFLTAGAVAVQLDSVVWRNPKMAEAIVDAVHNLDSTRTQGAIIPEPPHLPEMPPPEEDATQESNFGDEFSSW